MKKQRFYLIGILFMLAVNTGFGQNNANELIKKAVKSIRDPKNAEMTFSYTIQSDNTKNAPKQKGKAYLQGDAYKLVMDEQETICDGKTIWTYLVEDEEVMVSNASDGSDNTPLKIITSLDKDYSAKIKGTDDKGFCTIELNAADGMYKNVIATIDSKKNQLKHLKINTDDGNTIIIDIDEWKFNQDWKEDFFSFDAKAHPSVEVIDMR
jgi:outer membrane lipoprotein-sorting protein